jgi:hypothetical protein
MMHEGRGAMQEIQALLNETGTYDRQIRINKTVLRESGNLPEMGEAQ